MQNCDYSFPVYLCTIQGENRQQQQMNELGVDYKSVADAANMIINGNAFTKDGEKVLQNRVKSAIVNILFLL